MQTDELVFILAATNLPWELDAAMLRRLEKRVSSYFGAFCFDRIIRTVVNSLCLYDDITDCQLLESQPKKVVSSAHCQVYYIPQNLSRFMAILPPENLNNEDFPP